MAPEKKKQASTSDAQIIVVARLFVRGWMAPEKKKRSKKGKTK